jgi:PTS system cellobiose-specific IIC component
MNAEKRSFLEKISNVSDKASSNAYLQGISQGVMAALPFIIIGAFASLFMGLPIGPWKSFINSTGIASALTMLVNATTNFLGVIVTYFVARSFSDKMEVTSKSVGFLAVVFYLVLLPSYVMKDGTAYLSYDFLGTKGMLIGIIIAIVTVKVFKTVVVKNITIKMPAGTPPFVSNSFAALIPSFIIVVIALIIRLIFAVTPFGDAFNFIYKILQSPLQTLVGQNIWSIILLTSIASFVFSLGIHSGFITGMLAPILFALDGANQGAYAAGHQVPNMIGMAFVYSTTTAVFYPAMAIAVLVFSKSKQLKTVGKIGVVPSFFGISEPLVFGIPVVFNPVFMIPWVLLPAINQLIAYFLINTGLVHRYLGATVFNVPMIFTGLMNGGISIVIMEIALFILDIILFIPFVKLTDKKYLAAENSPEHTENKDSNGVAIY